MPCSGPLLPSDLKVKEELDGKFNFAPLPPPHPEINGPGLVTDMELSRDKSMLRIISPMQR
jgi:hypothetical protein